MTKEAVVFGVAGTCFGLLVGWIIGTQQTGPAVAPPPAAQNAAAPAPDRPPPPPLDLQMLQTLEQEAKARPADGAVRARIGQLYFEAERFDQAIPWFEAALKLDPKNIDVSTDLAVCYHYADDPDRALAQLERSLAINPRHPTTLLYQGTIRAFGKRDLAGAFESWQKVVEYAPDSPEAVRAKVGLDGLRSAHGADAAPAGRGGGGL
jgi:tetratricopeptide (TPR) repeat protein